MILANFWKSYLFKYKKLKVLTQSFWGQMTDMLTVIYPGEINQIRFYIHRWPSDSWVRKCSKNAHTVQCTLCTHSRIFMMSSAGTSCTVQTRIPGVFNWSADRLRRLWFQVSAQLLVFNWWGRRRACGLQAERLGESLRPGMVVSRPSPLTYLYTP